MFPVLIAVVTSPAYRSGSYKQQALNAPGGPVSPAAGYRPYARLACFACSSHFCVVDASPQTTACLQCSMLDNRVVGAMASSTETLYTCPPACQQLYLLRVLLAAMFNSTASKSTGLAIVAPCLENWKAWWPRLPDISLQGS